MSELILPRRRFLLGVASLLAAPAVIRVAKLMPISAQPQLWYVNTPLPFSGSPPLWYTSTSGAAPGVWEGFISARTIEDVKRVLSKNQLPVTTRTIIATLKREGVCVQIPHSEIYSGPLTHYEFRPPS